MYSTRPSESERNHFIFRVPALVGPALAGIVLTCIFLTMSGGGALASEPMAGGPAVMSPAAWPKNMQTAKRPPCRCRYDGRKYALGDVVCIRAPSGSQRAMRCGMELNNTSWITVQGGCTPVS